ncbi:hypothetical protein LMG23992_01018 [Cupriavidus laharis]|uniref:ATPase P n=1 Tax=Cupriavidus laharis TaxID=151654 RepID=A0ABM8WL32_9BURK|nr:hypothetical protein [Cupriavidus laharis]CAG9168100.1 hypothetical protein LMG23992_01018 [Cupriavidus laharis]
MIELDIPGFGLLTASALALDFNGTLAQDGRLISGVAERINKLADSLRVHVITGDTYGTARAELSAVRCDIETLPKAGQVEAKRAFLASLPRDSVVAVGNGRNDLYMLRAARLSIAVLGTEGMAGELFSAADIVVPHIHTALDLLLYPERLLATLRA